MDGASTEAVHTYIYTPYDYVSLSSFHIMWTRNAAGTGNVKWQATVLVDSIGTGGTDLTGAGTSVAATDAVPTANQIKYKTMAVTLTNSARLVRLTIERLGGDAQDSFDNLDAIFLGVVLDYNADT